MMPEPIYDATSSVAKIGSKIRTGFVPAPGLATLSGLSYTNATKNNLPHIIVGEQLRDNWWQKFPIIPAMVSSFSQIATSREWTITGRPRVASRALDKLHNAMYVDYYGQVYEGWSQFTGRRIIDWLMLGVNGMIVPSDTAPIQYIDPLEVRHVPAKARPRIIMTKNAPEWKDYLYLQEEWSNKQIFFNYYLPFGYTGATMAPLVPAIPLARLLYLIQQHDMASVDGRKIKDIFLVADDNISKALQQALVNYVSMQTGEFDPDRHGIPIVAMNKRGGLGEGESVGDQISLLGISNIPETLDRDQLWDTAAIEFSSLVGMQVTEWWHIKSGANNRSTERVNQERGRTKGPNYYCRQDQRFLNNSGVLGKVHYAYVEEVDIQAQKDRAEVMLRLSEAVKNLQEAVGMAISPRSLIRWLQHLGVFPTDDYLIDEIIMLNEDPVKPADMVDSSIEQLLAEQEQRDRETQRERELEDAELAAEKQRLLIEAQQSSSPQEEQAQRSILRLVEEVEYARSLDVRPEPEYGDVTIDSQGMVLEYRRPVYRVEKLLEREIKKELQEEHDVAQQLDDVFDESFGSTV